MGVRVTSPLTCVVITADKIEILKATISIKKILDSKDWGVTDCF